MQLCAFALLHRNYLQDQWCAENPPQIVAQSHFPRFIPPWWPCLDWPWRLAPTVQMGWPWKAVTCQPTTQELLPIWKSHRKGLDLPSRGAVKEYLKKISMLVAPRLTYPNRYKSYWRRWAPAVPGRSSILGAQMVSYWLTRLGGGGHQLQASSAIRIYKRSIRASSAISSPNSGNLVRFNKIAASILFTLVCNVANACNTRLDWSFTVLYEKGIFCDRACSQNWYISASEHKINPINLTFVQDVDFFLTKKKYFEGDTRVSHNTHFF